MNYLILILQLHDWVMNGLRVKTPVTIKKFPYSNNPLSGRFGNVALEGACRRDDFNINVLPASHIS